MKKYCFDTDITRLLAIGNSFVTSVTKRNTNSQPNKNTIKRQISPIQKLNHKLNLTEHPKISPTIHNSLTAFQLLMRNK